MVFMPSDAHFFIMKIKRHIVLPATLAIYAVVMAIIGYPNYRESGKMNEFWLIIGVCIVLAISLYFVLKRREKNRERFK